LLDQGIEGDFIDGDMNVTIAYAIISIDPPAPQRAARHGDAQVSSPRVPRLGAAINGGRNLLCQPYSVLHRFKWSFSKLRRVRGATIG